MTREFVTAVRVVIVTVLMCCLVYPLGILVIAIVFAPHDRLGSLVLDRNGQPVGSRLVAQAFQRPEYVWPRPSAVAYDAAASGGSNLSPLSPLVRERAEEILGRLSLPIGCDAPADLLASSGSGLDPHISLAGALIQAPRLANRRRSSENEIRHLIERLAENSAPSALGGEPLINVLLLNMALDEAFPVP